MLSAILLLVLGYVIGHVAGARYTRDKINKLLTSYEIPLIHLGALYPVRCAISVIQNIRSDIQQGKYRKAK